jgi:N-acetylglutamate synthase
MKYKKFTIDNYSQFRRLLEDTEGVSNREADSYEGIERYLLRNPGFSFSAFEGNSMVACVLCGHDGRRGYLQHVMVKPDYRRKGIASELIKRCLDELAKIGIMKTHIDVFKKNDLANSYWQKNGWKLREDINRYSYNRSNNSNV